MSNFGLDRNVDLSTIYALEEAIEASWDNVTVVLGFPNTAKANDLPIIAIRLLSIDSSRKEIGAITFEDIYTFIIDIFATSDGQRLDLASFIKDTINGLWTYYEHGHPSGDNSTLTRTEAGKIIFKQIINNARVDFYDDIDAVDRFRHSITFTCRVQLT
jgi:hypothetical protein